MHHSNLQLVEVSSHSVSNSSRKFLVCHYIIMIVFYETFERPRSGGNIFQAATPFTPNMVPNLVFGQSPGGTGPVLFSAYEKFCHNLFQRRVNVIDFFVKFPIQRCTTTITSKWRRRSSSYKESSTSPPLSIFQRKNFNQVMSTN